MNKPPLEVGNHHCTEAAALSPRRARRLIYGYPSVSHNGAPRVSKRLPLEDTRLDQLSREFLSELRKRVPEIVPAVEMEPSDEPGLFQIVANLDSPPDDPERALGIWMEQDVGPSVGYGPWHTHADVWRAGAAFWGGWVHRGLGGGNCR